MKNCYKLRVLIQKTLKNCIISAIIINITTKRGDIMEPYKAQKLPIEYFLDKDVIRILAQANEKYGQYKSLLNLFRFDQRFFLDSLIIGESVRSSRIEGTQISQDDMYYTNYKETNDNVEEVKNLKKCFESAPDR